jgi:hypothetical protein
VGGRSWVTSSACCEHVLGRCVDLSRPRCKFHVYLCRRSLSSLHNKKSLSTHAHCAKVITKESQVPPAQASPTDTRQATRQGFLHRPPRKIPTTCTSPHTTKLRSPVHSNLSRRRRSKAATSTRHRVGSHNSRAPPTPVTSAVPHRAGWHHLLEFSLIFRAHMCTWLAASYPLRQSSRPGHAGRG